MRIRLTGTPAECAAAAAIIRTVIDVTEESTPVPNRHSTRLVRVYLDAQILAQPDSTHSTEGGQS